MARYDETILKWQEFWLWYRKKKMEEMDLDEDDNQGTMAIGWSEAVPSAKLLGAKQGGTLPDDVAGFFAPPGYAGQAIGDARTTALKAKTAWSASNQTGIHAEMLIIRAWLVDLGQVNATGLAALSGKSVIVASQPACHCCHAFMLKHGIAFPKDAGKKPLTGWRSPISDATVANADLPATLLATVKWMG